MHWAQVNATVAEILDGKIADDAASDRAGRARGLLFEFAQGFFFVGLVFCDARSLFEYRTAVFRAGG